LLFLLFCCCHLYVLIQGHHKGSQMWLFTLGMSGASPGYISWVGIMLFLCQRFEGKFDFSQHSLFF
jgi:hypothetical protein